MARTKQKSSKALTMASVLEKHHKRTNYIFLGIGLTLFVMNITAYLSFVKNLQYDFLWFNTAIFSSMIIVLIAVYYITEIYE